MASLLVHHLRHLIGHGPHALADLGFTLQAGTQADINVPVFIGNNPWLLLHHGLLNHGAGFHAGMNLITGAVKETGINEDHAFTGNTNAFFQVQGRAALFIHDADLERVALEPQCLFNAGEQVNRKLDFFRAMHLRLYDVDTAGAGV